MIPPIEKFLGDSTVHSLVHFTGERRLYLKFFWLSALIISFILCCMRISEAFIKFQSREVSTTVKEGALNFEFPDVHICNENPISGSFSVTLSSEDTDLLNQYKRMINETVVRTAQREDWLDEYSLRLINTLPYQFLSDVMGHQTWQDVIDLTINDADKRTSTAVIFRHNTYLNCIRLNLTQQDRDLLSGPSSRLSITLFVDPQVPAPVDNSTDQDVFLGFAGSTNLKPFDWDFNYGYDYSRASGFRVFFTPKGHQPSEWSAQFVAGVGQRQEVALKMKDTVSKPEDFVGQCVDVASTASVDYACPYSGERQWFAYELYACMHIELARLSQESFNCSAIRNPLPWEYRHLPSCLNVTAISGLNLTDFYRNYSAERSALSGEALKLCRSKVPCRRRFYTYEIFSTNWPSERLFTEYLMGFTDYKMLTEPTVSGKTHLPGIRYMLDNGTVIKAKVSLLQLTLSASDEKSPETQMAIAYNFNSLIADVGGLLGLFLGMSLLSVLELLELLHDCFLVAYQRLSKRHKAVSDSLVSVIRDSNV